MKPNSGFLAAGLLAVFHGLIATAGPKIAWNGLEDAHLDVIPRTRDERARVAAVTAPPTDFSAPWPFEENPGGAQTVRARAMADAFSQPAANLTFEQELEFRVGNGMFRRVWVSAPASTIAYDGLGPLYNARSCQRCHLKDGRGHPPEGPEETAVSMFLRVSIPAADVPELERHIAGAQAMAPEPTYGTQLQDFSLPGHAPEARMRIEYEETLVQLSDGEVAHLRRPTYTAADLGYGPLHPRPRLAHPPRGAADDRDGPAGGDPGRGHPRLGRSG